jgi:hypothetical protein
MTVPVGWSAMTLTGGYDMRRRLAPPISLAGPPSEAEAPKSAHSKPTRAVISHTHATSRGRIGFPGWFILSTTPARLSRPRLS